MSESTKTIAEVLSEREIKVGEREAKQQTIYAAEPILKVNNLSTWFPIKKGLFGGVKDYVKAVDDVSLQVYPGEVLGLVGESGCGKTTLGRSILRLVEPTHGEVIFDGINIRNLEREPMRKMRKNMQIIFQDPYSSLNPRMTIGYAILEPMIVHKLHNTNKERKQKVMELLEKVGLSPNHYNRYPHEFSGGQRQRICIARSLAVNPKFIICDESVSALDVSVQAQVLNLLTQLKTELKLTYIFISHDLSVVRFIAD
ncbi:MAG: dipeptide/oligopeptide/nickel ABC transporter ATP-binding protein, partial [Bacteroidetes bacterium]|nr:dipeptide/oligopeptide/nickel ABC transporter ATP-binding protein [Bacteroidota bacterium]